MELVGAPLLVVQQPVVPQVDRVHAGRGRHEAVEVVRRLPRPRGVLQRPLRPADQGADRHAGGAGRAGLHVVPRDHARRQHDGPGRLRRSNIRRCTIWRRAAIRCCAFVHDRLLYLDPEPHRDTFIKPFHREQTPEFCSSCHKVHLDVPVNGYRWFRGFNDYDNWQASGVSGEGARSFYYPPKPQRCADCHMPLVPSNDPAAKNGMVRSHRFAAREHRAAVRQRRRGAAEGGPGVPAGRAGLGRHLRHRARTRAPAPDRRRRSSRGRSSGSSSTFAVGEESMNFGARQRVHRRAGRGHRRRSARSTRSVRARRIGARRSRRAHAQGRPFLPRRHGRRVRRLGRARGDRRHGPRRSSQRRASRTAARGRSIRARTSIAACCSTSTAIRSTSATRGPRDRSPTSG